MRTTLCVLLSLFLFAGLVYGQASRVSLDGVWRLTPIEEASSPGSSGQDSAQERETRPPIEIQVPGDWERELGSEFDGNGSYERDFEFALREGERAWIRFRAVMTYARVFVNEQEIGSHLGGWTPFTFEATEAMRGRVQHRLRVLVEERVGHNTQGFLPAIQPHFGGIWQSVELVHGESAVFDADRSELWGRYDEQGAHLRITVGLLAKGARYAVLAIHDELGRVAGRRFELDPSQLEQELRWRPKAELQPWCPKSPKVYRGLLRLLDEQGRPLDAYEQSIGFRDVDIAQDGRTILLNGKPITYRGILHWGYEPPYLAPDESPEHWAWQMQYTRSLGFNMIKACLWLPPHEFYEAALEHGVLVWNEYPTWHPDMSGKHREELLREYEEFYRYDRSLAPVVARSLTCETGHHNADKEVVQALFERCKEVTDARLVIDDSSWISWSRFGDFFDDHPYGNCGNWLSRLEGFDKFIQEKGPKPFLLGEAITSDTWLDFDKLDRVLSQSEDDWWRPFGWEHQRVFEERLRSRYGAQVTDELVPVSERYGLAARKYQIETFRRRLPRAGYVSSVMRDITKCRMGFLDDLGEPKWTEAQWDWHGERMLVLDDARARRAMLGGARSQGGQFPAVRIAGPAFEDLPARGRAQFEISQWSPGARWKLSTRGDDSFATEGLVHDGLLSEVIAPRRDMALALFERQPSVLQRADVTVRLGDLHNTWRFYAFGEDARPAPQNVRVAREMTPELLQWVQDGGRLLLLAGGKGSLKSQGHWFLRGSPWAPQQHPLWRRVPREMLFELQPLDFDGPMFRQTELTRDFAPIFGFWDTHDLADHMDEWLFLAETQVGKGRILACALDLSLEEEPLLSPKEPRAQGPNPAREWLRTALMHYLAEDCEPGIQVAPERIEAWKSALAARRIELAGTWKLQKDPKNLGYGKGFEAAGFDASGWIDSRVGIHWEHAGLPQYTGIAWYQKHFTIPEDWPMDRISYLIFEGVDDSYQVWLNGQQVGSAGNPETKETVWLIRTQHQVQRFLRRGKNTLTLRVVDHAGAGGIWKPVRLSTADPDVESSIEMGR
jgi:hypothetical protein